MATDKELTDAIKALYTEFRSVGITGTTALANAAQKYQVAYNQYLQNKNYYDKWWATIYGTSPGSFSFTQNPFAMAAVSSGQYRGYDLSDIAIKANMLETTVGNYEKLGGATTTWDTPFENLNYSQFQELSAMYGGALPSQAQFARLKTDEAFSVGGKFKSGWEKIYENFRKGRQGLFSEEETKTAYQQTEEGFAISGLKSKQKY